MLSSSRFDEARRLIDKASAEQSCARKLAVLDASRMGDVVVARTHWPAQAAQFGAGFQAQLAPCKHALHH